MRMYVPVVVTGAYPFRQLTVNFLSLTIIQDDVIQISSEEEKTGTSDVDAGNTALAALIDDTEVALVNASNCGAENTEVMQSLSLGKYISMHELIIS